MYDKKKTKAFQSYQSFLEMQPQMLAALKSMSQKEFVEHNILNNELLIQQSNIAQIVRRKYFSTKQIEELHYLPTMPPPKGTKLVALTTEGVQLLEKGTKQVFAYSSEEDLPKTEGVAYLYRVIEPTTASGREATVHLLEAAGEYRNDEQGLEVFWY